MCIDMDTQKKSTDSSFFALGRRIAELRQAAGILSQAELAGIIKSSQQTVSRWEAGTSRPRDKQMPLLAAVLKTDVEELLTLAGFSGKGVVATFDQPFPVDALSAESFERFCQHLLQSQYPDAKVYRAGGQGHTQNGVDITVDFPNGTSASFQCKRTTDFGPQKVRAAIEAHTVAAMKKVLLLSKTASPQARAAAHEYPGWEIWDKEDLSLKARQLPKQEQIRLVDTFFSGQRLALLGVDETGPWETTQAFYKAFADPKGVFNHQWGLVGRKNVIDRLMEALEDRAVSTILLSGAGGSGKSRVLKQAIEEFQEKHPQIAVRFASRTAEVTKKALEGLGSQPKLLVVDDAHERSDIELLFQYAANPDNETKLLLAFRPYGLDHIKAQASGFSLVDSKLKEVSLQPLTDKEAEVLAAQALKEHDGPAGAAEDIARLTKDCPLATVVGAYVVAKERKRFDFTQQEGTFRTMLFGRFTDVIAGELGSRSESEAIKKVLPILALLQPFHPEDKALLAIIETIEHIRSPEASRIMRLLTDAGILFKRGMRYRISPDVLADYIVEANCITVEGGSSQFAEAVFALANAQQIENLLVNLCRLDWRRSNGDPSNSRLVDGIWNQLNPQSEYQDPHIRAVRAVAYYQPLKAIEFAEKLIRERKFLNQLPDVLNFAAFNLTYLTRACEGLWELSKRDSRPLNQHSGHPIRVLAQLCEVQPNKPFEYNEVVVDFGLRLMKRADSWQHSYTPLDFLKTIFQVEGHTTTSQRFALTFQPYFISANFAAPLRKKVLHALVELLPSADVKVAVLAARGFGDAFRYPIGQFNAKVDTNTSDQWTGPFVEGLSAIEAALKDKSVDPLVFVAVLNSLSWHANYATGETSVIARRIRARSPETLEFRVIQTLIDGYGSEMRRFDPKNHEEKLRRHIESLVNDLLSAYPDAKDLRLFIAKALAHIGQNYDQSHASPYVLYEALIRTSPDFSRATLEDALAYPESTTQRFVPGALGTLWANDPKEARQVASRLIESDRESLLAAVGQAYSIFFHSGQYEDSDIKVFETLVASGRTWIAQSAIGSLRGLSEADAALRVQLALKANIGSSNKLADDLLFSFIRNQSTVLSYLTEDDVDVLFQKLMAVAELDGHWIEEFLAAVSFAFPERALSFFKRRIDYAASQENWNYRPINHGPYCHVRLRFRETSAFPDLMRDVAEWMKANHGAHYLFRYRVRELCEAIFGPYDEIVVSFLDAWVSVSDENDLEIVSNILKEAQPSFIFDYRDFVERILERAKILGSEPLKNVLGSLMGSAISGIRSGIAGEPMPQDIEMKEKSEEALRTLPRFSPAFELYDEMRRHADDRIADSRRTKEAFED
jgi:transcriptional regulator with XRE-family HTH domain